ncbi:MAG: acyltransferase [Clostridia bacterium]|nr:acyltransferase [Clostridia bacterium]
MTETKHRHCGIEILRMLSMFFICMLHTLGQGMVLGYSKAGTPGYRAAWFLEIGAYCAVNCYALISGYVGRKSRFRISRPIMIWLEVLFYTLLITAGYAIFKPELIVEGTWFNAAFPIMQYQYWYMTAFFGMVIFQPVLNKAINGLPIRTLSLTLAGVMGIMCFLPAIFDVSVFGLSGGYSAFWLCIMYIAGGWLSRLKEEMEFRPPVWLSVLVYFAAVGITFFLKLRGFGRWVNYTSPTIVISGIAIFLACAGIDPKSRPVRAVIQFLAPSSLAVYLIHVHPLIWDDLVKGFAKAFAKEPWYILSLKSIGAALVIFTVCLLIDLIRRGFFRLIQLRKLLGFLDGKLEKLFYGKKENT